MKKDRRAVAVCHSSGFRQKKRSSHHRDDDARSRRRRRHRQQSRRDAERESERRRLKGLRDRRFINDGEDEEDEEEDEGAFEMVQRRSRRSRKEINYKFEDFDSAINSAIQEEVVEHKKGIYRLYFASGTKNINFGFTHIQRCVFPSSVQKSHAY